MNNHIKKNMGSEPSHKYIDHIGSMPEYAPPGHRGTVNVRLSDRSFCENFEMVLGRIDPGGQAERHHHNDEHQAIYVLSGCARVTLAEEPPVDCGPGSVINIPPNLDHHVLSAGSDTLEMIIIYSPPLPIRDDVVVDKIFPGK